MPSYISDSLIDYVTAKPEAIPEGWTMENDQMLEDDQECIGLFQGSEFDPPGTYAIAEAIEGPATEYGSSVDHHLRASIWTQDPGLAICLARAASAYQLTEVNPGWEISIEARPSPVDEHPGFADPDSADRGDHK